MEKTVRVSQIYGYLVCLIAVITFLISITQLVNALIDLSDPIHAGWTSDKAPCLASFQNYKMDVLKSTTNDDKTVQTAYVPDDKTLHEMYQAAVNDKIALERHRALRSIIFSGLLVIVCVALFVTHWRWMQSVSHREG
jgi:hypothetical protein